MKIGILSFNNAYNYGGILQIYALQKTIEKMHKIEVINYKSNFIDKCYEKPKIKKLIKPRTMYNILFRNTLQLYHKEGFDKFKKENLNTSDTTYNENNFDDLGNDFNKIIVGSDQVWSLLCNGNDLNYFLPFKNKNCKKYSYAASLGTAEPNENLKNAISEYLIDFKMLSTRETTGKNLIENIIDKNVSVNCDPTLLLTKDDWSKICKQRLISEDYVLIYMLYEDKNIIKLAKKIAKERKQKVVYINNRFFKTFGVLNMSKISPEEWVNLFYHASYVITNSFHGIAFSINFNKQFQCSLLPHNNKANVRIIDILHDYKLDERIEQNAFTKKINYQKINETLKQNRNKSISYLKEIIND